MPDTTRLRATLLRVATDLLNLHYGPDVGAITVSCSRGLTITVRSEPEQPEPQPQPPADLPRAQRQILTAIKPTPQGARRIARQAGMTHNTYFRSQLSQLVDAGLVRRVSRGYRTP